MSLPPTPAAGPVAQVIRLSEGYVLQVGLQTIACPTTSALARALKKALDAPPENFESKISQPIWTDAAANYPIPANTYQSSVDPAVISGHSDPTIAADPDQIAANLNRAARLVVVGDIDDEQFEWMVEHLCPGVTGEQVKDAVDFFKRAERGEVEGRPPPMPVRDTREAQEGLPGPADHEDFEEWEARVDEEERLARNEAQEQLGAPFLTPQAAPPEPVKLTRSRRKKVQS